MGEPTKPVCASLWLAAPRSWLAGHWDLLVLLLFVFASTDPVWISRVLPVVHDTNYADDSWHLDEVFKLSRGVWVGRDVAFTHGPIFQWLSSVPARFKGVSMGTIYATWITVPAWCAFVFVYLTLRLLLAEQPAWKRALLLSLLLVFWLVFWEWSLQIAFPILLFAIFLRGWYAVTEERAKSYALGIVAALLCAIAFLIASDTGLYSAAAWLIATAAFSFEEGWNKHVIGRCIVALVAYTVSGFVFALAVNAVMGSVFDFRFWRDSAHIVSIYRWATPTAMTNASTVRLLVTLFVSAAVFLFRASTRSKQNAATTERTAFLLGGFAFALVMLQSALVRSDSWHVDNGDFAMVLLAGTILFSVRRARMSFAAVLLAIACSILSSHRAFGLGTVIRLVQQLRRPPGLCPDGFREFDHGCFAPEFTAMLQSTTSYLDHKSGPQEHIVVFPYQTMFGIASRRSVAGGLMQAYTATGPYLSQLEIGGLESAPAPAGLYATDLKWGFRDGHAGLSETDMVRCRNLALSAPIDGTYNFTRTPEAWFWMLRHYQAEGRALSDGIFGLLRDDSRAARISMQAQTLGLAAQVFPIRERKSVVDLGSPVWPAGADFLRLRLTLRYGFWWKLRKPENMQVEITRADGSTELRSFIAQPNVSSEIWLYPWDQPDLANYLDADETHWRTTPQPAITRLRIVLTPWDWVSVAPSAIELEAADSVRIDMRP
jgi:hypothetical protein